MSKRVPLICGGHSRPVPHLSFSPELEDGLFMVSGCLDGRAMLRYGRSGDWIGTFCGHKGAIWSARINSSASLVLTGSADFSIKLWSAVTGKEKATLEHQHVVKTVDFSPDEKQCLSAGLDKKVKVWDVSLLEPVATLEKGHSKGITSALWLGDNLVISGGGDPGLRLWDLRAGSVVQQIDTLGPVKSLETSSLVGGKTILSCASGKSAMFFSPDEGFVLHKQYTFGGDINWASLRPELGDQFVVACVEGFRVMVYDYNEGTELTKHSGHHGPPHCVKWSPDGKYFASGSDDGTIRLWRDVEEVKEEQRLMREQKQIEEKEAKEGVEKDGQEQDEADSGTLKRATVEEDIVQEAVGADQVLAEDTGEDQ